MPADLALARPVPPLAAEAATLTEAQAVRLSGFCGRSLKRWAEAGEPLGRFKQGRAVRYHRQTLLDWLQSKAAPAATG